MGQSCVGPQTLLLSLVVLPYQSRLLLSHPKACALYHAQCLPCLFYVHNFNLPRHLFPDSRRYQHFRFSREASAPTSHLGSISLHEEHHLSTSRPSRSLPFRSKNTAKMSSLGPSRDKDYHTLLGVDPGVSLESLGAAFSRLAVEKHPDNVGNTPEANAEYEGVSFAISSLEAIPSNLTPTVTSIDVQSCQLRMPGKTGSSFDGQRQPPASFQSSDPLSPWNVLT